VRTVTRHSKGLTHPEASLSDESHGDMRVQRLNPYPCARPCPRRVSDAGVLLELCSNTLPR